jgi:hypothetical protein
VDIDQARLRPHLRIRARRVKADNLAHEVVPAEAGWYRLPVDPRGLRGIPVIGVAGAGGAIAGTQPDRALLAKESVRRLR